MLAVKDTNDYDYDYYDCSILLYLTSATLSTSPLRLFDRWAPFVLALPPIASHRQYKIK